MKMFQRKIALLLAALMLLALLPACAEELDLDGKVVIACVGDSITKGVGASDPEALTYPAQLQALLGDAYAVVNCGNSGGCIQADSDNPYHERKAYATIGAYTGPVYLIHGTEDKTVPLLHSERALEVYPNAQLQPIEGGMHGFQPLKDGTNVRELACGYILAFLKGNL